MIPAHQTGATPNTTPFPRGRATVAGFAMNEHALALAYLSTPAKPARPPAPRVRLHDLYWVAVKHAGIDHPARVVLARELEKCWTHAHTLVAYDPLRWLNRHRSRQVIGDLVGLWPFRGTLPDTMGMLDIAHDLPAERTCLVDHLLDYHSPRSPNAVIEAVVTEAAVTAALAADHLGLTTGAEPELPVLLRAAGVFTPPAHQRPTRSAHRLLPATA